MPATLRSLRIRNLALVESLDWKLGAGFSVVTGETGAGKSIILGALKLLLGERADKSLIRTGSEQCSVEALFQLDQVEAIDRLLSEQGIELCEEDQLLLKRVFAVSGSNRQFVNGSQTTLAALKQIADGLVDLHGPHDHQSLFSRDQQLKLVDAFAGHSAVLDEYQAAYREAAALRQRRAEILDQTAAEKLELWNHRLQELVEADLKPGELQQLEAKQKVHAHGRQLLQIAATVLGQLSDSEDSIANRLREIGRQLRELHRLDESGAPFIQSLQTVIVELEELERSLAAYHAGIELEPAALERLEERISLVHSLQRKHHRDEAGLIELTGELRERLESNERRGEILADVDARLQRTEFRLQHLSKMLTQSRIKAASELAANIHSHLDDLGFARASFEIELERLEPARISGSEQVEFMFASNPGEPLRPLRAIASSGEISRVMLAIKTALAQQDLVGLLVFDEIDANIGGEIAHTVGAKMRSLGLAHQVLAITHMPQVAAAARSHFYVSKQVAAGRTRTLLQEVSGQSRIEELARMLGGKTKSALDHARELLKANR